MPLVNLSAGDLDAPGYEAPSPTAERADAASAEDSTRPLRAAASTLRFKDEQIAALNEQNSALLATIEDLETAFRRLKRENATAQMRKHGAQLFNRLKRMMGT